MIDKERILAKIDELNNYLEELGNIKPSSFEEYQRENKRACERLLQISIECVIDVCNLIVSGLKLGLPSDEDELVNKLINKKIISKKIGDILKGMKGFRNILVHKYGEVDDELAFENLENLEDFEKFKKEII